MSKFTDWILPIIQAEDANISYQEKQNSLFDTEIMGKNTKHDPCKNNKSKN